MKIKKFNESFLDKYVKTPEEFEEIRTIKDEPQIGDYVICEEDPSYSGLSQFISTKIGKIIGFSKNGYYHIVQYQNIPELLKFYFTYQDFDNLKRYYNCVPMLTENIKYWSKNKKDLEAILAANKYNL